MSRPRFFQRCLYVLRMPLLGALTGSGQALLIGCALCTYAFWGLPLVWLFCGFLWLLAISFFYNRFFAPQLQILARIDPMVRVGQSVKIRLQIENRGKRSAFDLQVICKHRPATWQFVDQQQCFDVAAGQTFLVELAFQVSQRGVFTSPELYLESTFPFGLTRHLSPVSLENQIVVAPAGSRGRSPALRKRLLQNRGVFESVMAADSAQYTHSREYVPGSPPGRWDYAAWSRIGKPVVRQYSNESQEFVHVYVDLSVPSKVKGELLSFEQMLDIAVAVLDRLRASRVHTALLLMGENSVESHALRKIQGYSAMLYELAAAKPVVVDLKKVASGNSRPKSRSQRIPTIAILPQDDPLRRGMLVQAFGDDSAALTVLDASLWREEKRS